MGKVCIQKKVEEHSKEEWASSGLIRKWENWAALRFGRSVVQKKEGVGKITIRV